MLKYQLAMALTFACSAASADNLSGNELLSICEANGDLAKAGFCLGYVTGVIEGMKWGAASPLLMTGTDASEAERISSVVLGFCSPDSATLGQFVDVVTLHLRNHPADRHGSARLLTQAALRDAFPCSQ